MGSNKDYKKDHYRPYSSYYGNNSSSSNHNSHGLSNSSNSNKRYYGNGSINNSSTNGGGGNLNGYYSPSSSNNVNLNSGGSMRRKYNGGGSNNGGYNSYRGGSRYNHDGGMHYEPGNNSSTGSTGSGNGSSHANHDHYYGNSSHHHSIHHHYGHNSSSSGYYGYSGGSGNYNNDKSDHTSNPNTVASSNTGNIKSSSNNPFNAYRNRQMDDHHKSTSSLDRDHNSYHGGSNGGSPYRHYQKELFPKKLQSEDSSVNYKRYSSDSGNPYHRTSGREPSSRTPDSTNVKHYSSPISSNSPQQSQLPQPKPKNSPISSQTTSINHHNSSDHNTSNTTKKLSLSPKTSQSSLTSKKHGTDGRIEISSSLSPSQESDKQTEEKKRSSISHDAKDEKVKTTSAGDSNNKSPKEEKSSKEEKKNHIHHDPDRRKSGSNIFSSTIESKSDSEQRRKSVSNIDERSKTIHKESLNDKKVNKNVNESEKDKKHKIKEVIKKVELNKDPEKKHSLFKSVSSGNSSTNLKKSGLFKSKESTSSLFKDKNSKSEKKDIAKSISNKHDSSDIKPQAKKSDVGKKSTPEIASKNQLVSEPNDDAKKKSEKTVDNNDITNTTNGKSEKKVDNNTNNMSSGKPRRIIDSDEEDNNQDYKKRDKQTAVVQPERKRPIDSLFSDDEDEDTNKDNESVNKKSRTVVNSTDKSETPLHERKDSFNAFKSSPLSDLGLNSVDMESEIVSPDLHNLRRQSLSITNKTNASIVPIHHDDKTSRDVESDNDDEAISSDRESSNDDVYHDDVSESETVIADFPPKSRRPRGKLVRSSESVEPPKKAGNDENVKSNQDAATKKKTNAEKKLLDKRDHSGRTKLMRACSSGKYDDAKELIEAGADVNMTDYAGTSILHEVALKGYYDIAKLLIEHHVDMNVKSRDDSATPVYDAACNSNFDIVELLLENGADPNICGTGNESLYSFLFSEGEKGKSILKKFPNIAKDAVTFDKYDQYFIDLIDSDEFYERTAKCDIEYVVDQLDKGYKPNATAVIIACIYGFTEMISFFLAFGFKVNTYSTKGTIPLHHAVGKNHLDLVQLLIQTDADPRITRKSDGLNSLQIATKLEADKDELKLLKDTMIKLNGRSSIKEKKSANPMAIAHNNGHEIGVSEIPNSRSASNKHDRDESNRKESIEFSNKYGEAEDNNNDDDGEVEDDDEIISKKRKLDTKRSHTSSINSSRESKKEKVKVIKVKPVMKTSKLFNANTDDHKNKKHESKDEIIDAAKFAKEKEPTIKKEAVIEFINNGACNKIIHNKNINVDEISGKIEKDTNIDGISKANNENILSNVHSQKNINSNVNDSNDNKSYDKAKTVSTNQLDADISIDSAESDNSKETINTESNSLNQKMKETVKRKQKMLLEKITANEKLRQKEKEEKKKRDEERILKEQEEAKRREIMILEKEEEERKQKSLLKNRKTRESYPVTLQCVQFYPLLELKKLDNYAVVQANFKQYLPLYYTIIDNEEYVTDLQLNLITGISDLYDHFPNLNNDKIVVSNFEQKKLWNFFSSLLMRGFLDISVLTENESKARNKSLISKRYENFENEGKRFECLLLNWVKLSTFKNEILPTLPMYENLIDFKNDVIQLDHDIFMDKPDDNNDNFLSSTPSSVDLPFTSVDSTSSIITVAPETYVTAKLPRKFHGRKMVMNAIIPSKNPLW